MLQQLQDTSKRFCEKKLATMRADLRSAAFESGNLSAPIAVGSEKFRTAAIETRQHTLINQLESAFTNALNNRFLDFNELLKQSDSGRPLSFAHSSADQSTLFADHMAEDQAWQQPFGELNQRLSVLSGMKVNSARNPFAPEAFAMAFEQSLASLQWSPPSLPSTADVFARQFLAELPPLYAQMNTILADGGILPDLSAANEARESSANLPETDRADPRENSSNAIHAPGPQPTKMPAAVFSKLPANDPEVARQLEEQAGRSEPMRDVHAAKTIALELVGQIINQLLSYDEVSLRLKTLLSRLYAPYSDLAKSDSRFPDEPDHPGHHLLRSVDRAVELFQNEAPVLQRPELVLLLEDFVDQLTAQPLTGRDAFLLAFRINAKLRNMERRIEARKVHEKPTANSLDRISNVQVSIKRQVSERLQQSETRIPARIEDFLLDTWTCYVASLYVNPTANRDQTERTLAMADRIMSYAGGRQRMTGDQYTVIAIAVRQAMTRSGATSPEIESFLQELKHAHAHPLADIAIGSHELDPNNNGVAKV